MNPNEPPAPPPPPPPGGSPPPPPPGNGPPPPPWEQPDPNPYSAPSEQDPYTQVDVAAVRKQVQGPAVALLVFSLVTMAYQLLSLMSNIAGIGQQEQIIEAYMEAMQQSMPDPAVQEQMRALLEMFTGPFAWAFVVLGIFFYALIALGAWKMKNLESYGLAMAAAILSMVPCNCCCCFIGLPLGIWALVVLTRENVKAAFT